MREIGAVIALVFLVMMAMDELSRPITYCIIAGVLAWQSAHLSAYLAELIKEKLLSFKTVEQLYTVEPTGEIRGWLQRIMRGIIIVTMQLIVLIIFLLFTMGIGFILYILTC